MILQCKIAILQTEAATVIRNWYAGHCFQSQMECALRSAPQMSAIGDEFFLKSGSTRILGIWISSTFLVNCALKVFKWDVTMWLPSRGYDKGFTANYYWCTLLAWSEWQLYKVKLFLGSKFLCALFWNSHSLSHFSPLLLFQFTVFCNPDRFQMLLCWHKVMCLSGCLMGASY